MFCKKCGAKVVEGARFCARCGQRLSLSNPPDNDSAGGQTTKAREMPASAPVEYVLPPNFVAKASWARRKLKIDVNQAQMEDILLLPGINLAEAQRIINQRERIGGFLSKDEFMEFLPTLGVQPHDYVQVQNLVEIVPLISKNARVLDF